jgi:hypothetical protein
MSIRSLYYAAALLGMLLLGTAAFGQSTALNSPISVKMRQSDERLNMPVTVSADRIYLGELLEILAARTGVKLSMDNTDSFSGTLVACDFKQTPLADVMNALWSLVSCKEGLWEWRPTTRQGATGYALAPTPAAQGLADRLHRMLQEMFDAKIERMMPLALMSPQERKANIDAEMALHIQVGDDNSWSGLKLMAELLSPAQRSHVVRGEVVDIPLVALSREGRRAALAFEQSANGTGNARTPSDATQPPEFLRFSGNLLEELHGGNDLFVMLGLANQGSVSLHSIAHVGSISMDPAVFVAWILPSDLPTLPLETKPLENLVSLDATAPWSTAPRVDRHLAQLASTLEVSFAAVVGDFPADYTFNGIGQTPAQHFSHLWNMPRMMHKWREGILLLNYPDWFYGDPGRCPYETIKRLRTSMHKQNGLFSLDDVAGPVTTLTLWQLRRLGEEFPFFPGRDTSWAFQPTTAICALYRRYPKSLNERGIAADLRMQALLRDLKLQPSGATADEDVTAVRIIDVPNKYAPDVRHTYTLQLSTSKRSWIDAGAFRIVQGTPKTLP